MEKIDIKKFDKIRFGQIIFINNDNNGLLLFSHVLIHQLIDLLSDFFSLQVVPNRKSSKNLSSITHL